MYFLVGLSPEAFNMDFLFRCASFSLPHSGYYITELFAFNLTELGSTIVICYMTCKDYGICWLKFAY